MAAFDIDEIKFPLIVSDKLANCFIEKYGAPNLHEAKKVAKEEIFGPVLSIMPFDSEDHAVELANDTNYGLTNYVQSEDDANRNRVARRLRSGMVEMNGLPRSSGSPFGGYKQSGNGREGGIWGLEDFLEVKSVSGWSN